MTDMTELASTAEAAGRARQRAAEPPRLTYCNLFLTFLAAAFLGASAETLFMLVVWHELQNRSGVLIGNFSLVWGLGAVLFTVALRGWVKRGPAWVFCGGALLGTVFEYACSVFQEALFGMRFWNYSHLPLSVDGRTNPIFSVFWGLAALLWMYLVWPALGRGLELFRPSSLRAAALVLTLFMVCDVAVSAAALARMDARRQNRPAANAAEVLLDRYCPDALLESRYPSMRYTGRGPS